MINSLINQSVNDFVFILLSLTNTA